MQREVLAALPAFTLTPSYQQASSQLPQPLHSSPSTGVCLYAWNLGIYGVIPFLMLFQCGYLYTGLWSLAQGLKRFSLPNPLPRLFELTRLRLSRPNAN